MEAQPWQLQMVERSLKKREKRRLLDKNLSIRSDGLYLDLGCAQGILSVFLRRKGGRWWSADLDFANLKVSQEVLKDHILQVEPLRLPFKSGSLDGVVSLDYLEHLEEDGACLAEIRRLLKPGGMLALAVPRTGRPFILHRLRRWMGMKPEFYGHKREGYSLKGLRFKLDEARLRLTRKRIFSRFITEFLELVLNFLYIKVFSKSQGRELLRDGHIRPASGGEFRQKRGLFRLYSALYPLVWLVSRVDTLMPFQRGYGLMVWAQKDE